MFAKCLQFLPQICSLNPELSSIHLNNYMPGSIPKTAAASPMVASQDEKIIKNIQTCKKILISFLMYAFCKQGTSIYNRRKSLIKYYPDDNACAPFLGCLIHSNDPLLQKFSLIFRLHCNELLLSQKEKL